MRKMYKNWGQRAVSWVLAAAIVCGLLPTVTRTAGAAYTTMPTTTATLTAGTTYEFPTGTQTYTANYTVPSGVVTVRVPAGADIIVNGSAGAPFSVRSGAELRLIINGKLTANGGGYQYTSYAGINIVSGGKLSIITESGDGRSTGILAANAGLCNASDGQYGSAAGIGGNGYGDGVPSESCGEVYIDAGTNVTATGSRGGGRGGGAGIGGGGGGGAVNGGDGGKITIYGTVYAEAAAGPYIDGGGAGIGGGGSYTGTRAGNGGIVHIMSGAQVIAKGSQTIQASDIFSSGAGIGGGGLYSGASYTNHSGGNGGTIIIEPFAQVTAVGGNTGVSGYIGVGIGGGSGGVAGAGPSGMIYNTGTVFTQLGTGGLKNNFKAVANASGDLEFIGSGCGATAAASAGDLEIVDLRWESIAEKSFLITEISETYYNKREGFGGGGTESSRHMAGSLFGSALWTCVHLPSVCLKVGAG